MLATYLEAAKESYPTSLTPWDFNENPDMCSVKMETKDGGHCKATVECHEGGRLEYNPKGEGWNVCFVGGRQYFNDPRIGDFSITFTEKDGHNQGEGLTTPVLQVKQFKDWLAIPVNSLAAKYAKYSTCLMYQNVRARSCIPGPYSCHYTHNSVVDVSHSRRKEWECAIPMAPST
ncbi:hypothetical protein BDU57DRAFT_541919 [Ampelomyces quisqualis]|uniref:Uncharacterized protein n=1 Tax=Ampelomyces quisqualis TaxID=50730 RepID=A0A6A5QEG7_AMPQU|nr:hypothetical protein BDU57DRAFT_541919 [Ampelomyces quisqualis]